MEGQKRVEEVLSLVDTSDRNYSTSSSKGRNRQRGPAFATPGIFKKQQALRMKCEATIASLRQFGRSTVCRCATLAAHRQSHLCTL